MGKRCKKPKSAVIHEIKTPNNQRAQEVVVNFIDDENNSSHFYLSGFDISTLPRVSPKEYAKGRLYLMGIGTAPLNERYTDLMQTPPENRSDFSVFVNDEGQWINHHDMAIDGSILFLDENDSSLMHLYLVSYERHAVIAHYSIQLPKAFEPYYAQ